MRGFFLTWVRFAVAELRSGKTPDTLAKAYRFMREAMRCAHHETREIRSSLFRMLNWLRADLRKAVA